MWSIKVVGVQVERCGVLNMDPTEFDAGLYVGWKIKGRLRMQLTFTKMGKLEGNQVWERRWLEMWSRFTWYVLCFLSPHQVGGKPRVLRGEVLGGWLMEPEESVLMERKRHEDGPYWNPTFTAWGRKDENQKKDYNGVATGRRRTKRGWGDGRQLKKVF